MSLWHHISKTNYSLKKVLEESLETLSRRWSNRGRDNYKFKIIDIDKLEISIDILLEKYFFNKEYYYASCSVILTKSYNNTIEHYSISDEQTKDSEIENT